MTTQQTRRSESILGQYADSVTAALIVAAIAVVVFWYVARVVIGALDAIESVQSGMQAQIDGLVETVAYLRDQLAMLWEFLRSLLSDAVGGIADRLGNLFGGDG